MTSLNQTLAAITGGTHQPNATEAEMSTATTDDLGQAWYGRDFSESDGEQPVSAHLAAVAPALLAAAKYALAIEESTTMQHEQKLRHGYRDRLVALIARAEAK